MVQGQKPLEILVIDDDKNITDLLARAIERLGHNASVANNGQAGIDEYARRHEEKKPYDGVLTDLKMPGVDGAEVVKRIKEISEQKTPVYVITGIEANEEYKALSQKLGENKPDGVIQKPFSMETIINTLKKISESVSSRNKPDYRPPTTYQS